MEPEKPFACTIPDCGMTFTNEDHLHVHTKKHDMVLQLGLEQKAAFVDQTPTPTRFIRNCEEVGLFQDLQNVNPFDEGFKRAMETKHNILSLEGVTAGGSSDDVLHTPHMVFPLIDSGDCALFSTTNNQRNITISRSSSDESGAVKEYETTTISKLTNEVTTISRVVGKDVLDRVTTTDDVSIVRHEETARNKDGVNETSVSYTNNIIKIHSNVEIRKDGNIVNIENTKNTQVPVTMISYTDSVIKDATNVVTKDVLLTDTNKLHVSQGKIPPIMSQKSLDFVVDNLTSDAFHNEAIIDKDKEQLFKTLKRNYDSAINKNNPSLADKSGYVNNGKNKMENKEGKNDGNDVIDNDYEVIIKLPNGKQVRMKAVEDDVATEKTVQIDTKEKLKQVLTNKVKDKSQSKIPLQRLPNIQNAQIIQNILPISTGTLIPVTIVSPPNSILQPSLPKVSIVPINTVKVEKSGNYKYVKRKPGRTVNKANKQVDTSVKCDVKNLAIAPLQNTLPEHCKDSNLSEDDCVIVENNNNSQTQKRNSPSKHYLENRSAASRRYRERLKETMRRQSEENRLLKESNKRLTAEKAELKLIITEHMRKCPIGDDLRDIQERLKKATTGL
ncbi:uncharacterized protein Atf-2 isoform X2 [Battus philenor]|uniref:uncharacterized protein Atf-2 isoform X2 n=1 Tax=Battus philenor TaxID=42288 RepID=UPI0035CFD79B